MSTPTPVLLLRATSHLDLAKIQLVGEKYDEAAKSIEAALSLIEEALR